MALEVRSKNVKENFEVVSVGYCDMQYLLSFECSHCYTCGVYGWNSDIYFMDSIGYSGTVISTGYRPVNGLKMDYELLDRNEKKARDIINSDMSLNEKKSQVRALLKRCIENALYERDR